MRSLNAVRYSLALLATLFATAAGAQSVDIRAASVDGVTNGVWSATGLGLPTADGIVLGQPLGEQYNNSAPTMVRQDGGGNIRLQNAGDSAVPATRVDLLALSGDLRALGIPAEIGTLDMDHSEQSVTFARPFAQTPVVFTTQTTQRGSEPAYTFAAHVDPQGATIKLREPTAWDGWHAVETVRYLAIEPGQYPLPGGRWLTVGLFDSYVGGGSSSRTIWPEVPLLAGATVIGAVQNTDAETPAQNITLFEGNPGEQAFSVTQHNFGYPSGHPVQSGYLIVGERVDPVAVTLLGSGPGAVEWERVQTGASIEYLTQPNNTCHTLADFGMDRVEQIDLVGAGRGRTTLALFDGPRCTGQDNTVDVDGTGRVAGDMWQLGLWSVGDTTRSFRIVWRAAAELTAAADSEVCFGPGEPILDNGAAILQLDADGDLGIFKRNPATGGLQASWTAGIQADTLCVRGDRSGSAQGTRLVALQGDAEVWSTNSNYYGGGMEPGRLALTDACTVDFKRGDYEWLWSAGEPGCHVGLSVPTPDPTPVPKLIFGDVDGDSDPEMVLMLTKADGSGFLMYDPLGIADFFFTVGLPPDADFIPALSQTQRDALQQQTVNAVPGGVTTLAQLLDLLERMHPAPQVDFWGNPVGSPALPSLYRTFEFEVAVDVSALEADAEWNGFEAGASVGNFEFEMHNDADSFGYHVSASAAEASVSYDGSVTVEASVLSAEAGMYVGNDGVAVGGGADLVAVTFTGGRQDRTHIGVSAGVGVGFWAEARWGRDDLYGFTLDLPIFPVGIAIYVRGDDVLWLGERIVWLVDQGLYHGERLANVVWTESSTWAVGAYGDSAVYLTNAYNDTRAFVEKSGNGALVGLGNGVDETVAWIDGAGWTLENAMNGLGSALESGVQDTGATLQQLGAQAGGWATGAANDAGSWFQGAANDVGNFFGGLF